MSNSRVKLEVRLTFFYLWWKGTDGCAASYRCGKSIFGQGILSSELGVAIDAQVEAPGHGKWWLDGKTGSDKRHCQRAMCMIYSPEAANSGRESQAAKWIERGGETFAVSPAVDECVRLLSDPTRINGIKSEGMRSRSEEKALVERNTYESYNGGGAKNSGLQGCTPKGEVQWA